MTLKPCSLTSSLCGGEEVKREGRWGEEVEKGGCGEGLEEGRVWEMKGEGGEVEEGRVWGGGGEMRGEVGGEEVEKGGGRWGGGGGEGRV